MILLFLLPILISSSYLASIVAYTPTAFSTHAIASPPSQDSLLLLVYLNNQGLLYSCDDPLCQSYTETPISIYNMLNPSSSSSSFAAFLQITTDGKVVLAVSTYGKSFSLVTCPDVKCLSNKTTSIYHMPVGSDTKQTPFLLLDDILYIGTSTTQSGGNFSLTNIETGQTEYRNFPMVIYHSFGVFQNDVYLLYGHEFNESVTLAQCINNCSSFNTMFTEVWSVMQDYQCSSVSSPDPLTLDWMLFLCVGTKSLLPVRTLSIFYNGTHTFSNQTLFSFPVSYAFLNLQAFPRFSNSSFSIDVFFSSSSETYHAILEDPILSSLSQSPQVLFTSTTSFATTASTFPAMGTRFFNASYTLGAHPNIVYYSSKCAPGSILNGSVSTCDVCKQGLISSQWNTDTSCVICSNNTYSGAKPSSKCESCPVGFVSPPQSSICSLCPSFTYATLQGCVPCPNPNDCLQPGLESPNSGSYVFSTSPSGSPQLSEGKSRDFYVPGVDLFVVTIIFFSLGLLFILLFLTCFLCRSNVRFQSIPPIKSIYGCIHKLIWMDIFRVNVSKGRNNVIQTSPTLAGHLMTVAFITTATLLFILSTIDFSVNNIAIRDISTPGANTISSDIYIDLYLRVDRPDDLTFSMTSSNPPGIQLSTQLEISPGTGKLSMKCTDCVLKNDDTAFMFSFSGAAVFSIGIFVQVPEKRFDQYFIPSSNTSIYGIQAPTSERIVSSNMGLDLLGRGFAGQGFSSSSPMDIPQETGFQITQLSQSSLSTLSYDFNNPGSFSYQLNIRRPDFIFSQYLTQSRSFLRWIASVMGLISGVLFIFKMFAQFLIRIDLKQKDSQILKNDLELVPNDDSTSIALQS